MTKAVVKKIKPKVEIVKGKLQVNDPKAQLFIVYYFDPKSDSFGSIRGSAIRAGFAESYADNLLNLAPKWLKTILDFYRDKHERMVAKAERNLEEFLDMDPMVQAMGPFGPIYEKEGTGKYKIVRDRKTGEEREEEIMKLIPIYVPSATKLKLKQDTSKFVAERLNKKKFGNQSQTANIFNTFNLTQEQMARVAKEFTLTIKKDGE